MQVENVTNKTVWEENLAKLNLANILQSWDFGVFAEALGRKIFRLCVVQNGRILGLAQVGKIISRRGNYLECLWGPAVAPQRLGVGGQDAVLLSFLNYLRDLGKQEKVDFVRILLPWDYDQEKITFLRKQGFVPSPMYFPAEHTWRLDLTQTSQQILANMRKDKRYGVGRAKRDGVRVQVFGLNQNPEKLPQALKTFFKMYQETVKRQKFVGFGWDYFEKQVNAFLPDDQVVILLADQNQHVAAGVIIYFYGKTAYYLHGASVGKLRSNQYDSSLLQWEAMQQAQKRGKQVYDFWGVAPQGASSNHPRAGFTAFKQSFGGYQKRWMPAMDLPLSPKYYLTYFYVKLEKALRHL